jgi:hypothetical protein
VSAGTDEFAQNRYYLIVKVVMKMVP